MLLSFGGVPGCSTCAFVRPACGCCILTRIVGAHDALGIALHHTGLESGPVCVRQGEVGDDGVEVVPGEAIGVLQAVCVPVLERDCCLEVSPVLPIALLETLGVQAAVQAVDEGVLAGRFGISACRDGWMVRRCCVDTSRTRHGQAGPAPACLPSVRMLQLNGQGSQAQQHTNGSTHPNEDHG